MASQNHIFVFFSKAFRCKTGKYMYHLHSVDNTITQKAHVCMILTTNSYYLYIQH